MPKKDDRLENKKRKIAAFLNIALMNENDRSLAVESKSKNKMTLVKDEHVLTKDQVEVDCSSTSDSDSDFESKQKINNHNHGEASNKCVEESKQKADDMALQAKINHPNFKLSESGLTLQELMKIRDGIKARQRAAMEVPKVFLTPDQLGSGKDSNNSTVYRFSQDDDQDMRPPLYVLDLQCLLLNAIQGQLASYKPRWCKLLRWSKISQILTIVVHGLSLGDFEDNQDCFTFVKSEFELNVEMISPSQYNSHVDAELYNVPVSIRLQETRISYESGNNEIKKTDLLLNPMQFLQENIPVPVENGKYEDYVYTKDAYGQVTAESPLFAVDCEMVLTTLGKHELARVSLVDESLNVVYDSFVKPYNRIINHLTKYSGITAEIMKNTTTRLKHVQEKIRRILPKNAILCGQSINSDLHSLKMFHPYIIDTSVIFNLTGQRNLKPSLKKLTAAFLNRQIQNQAGGHDSAEDAIATLELVLLKLKKGLLFGDCVLGGYQPEPDHNSMSHTLQKIKSDSQLVEPDSTKDTQESKVISDTDAQTRNENEPQAKKARLDIEESAPTKPDGLDVKPDTDRVKTNWNMSETKNDSQESSSSEKSNESGGGSCEDNETERKKLFFKNIGSNCYDDFFKLAKEQNKSVVLIDREEYLAPYENKVKTIPVTSDKEAKQRLCEVHWNHCLSVVNLRKGALRSDKSKQHKNKELLKKTDKRIQKMCKHLPVKSLVTILFSGNSENGENKNGVCFVKVMKS